MPEFWEVTHTRAQQTIAVWSTHNPTFQVETLDLATHQANTDLLFTQSGDAEAVKDVYDEAVDARDANVELIHTLNTRVPQLIRSNLSDKDLLQKEVKDVLKVDLGSMAKELKRARRLKSLWTRVNAKRAAQTPALPEIDRSGKTVTDLDAALTAHPDLLQDVEDKQAEWNQSKSVLEQTDEIVDDANKKWYEAWKNYYDEGTPEHDALSQITTEPGGGGGGGGPTTPPTVLEFAAVENAGNVDVTYVAGGGAGAETLQLLWQVEGVDPGFDNSVAVILGGQTVGPFSPAVTINFKTQATNSQGTVESGVQTIVMT